MKGSGGNCFYLREWMRCRFKKLKKDQRINPGRKFFRNCRRKFSSMAIFTLVRTCSVLLLLLMLCMCRKKTAIAPNDIIETQLTEPIAVTKRINAAFGGYYLSLPEHYSETSKKYPVLLFLHGAGQMGDGASDLRYLLNDGIGKLLREKKLPPSFVSRGKNYSFIVVSPQFSRQPQITEIAELAGYLSREYRIDERRFYLSGLSLGSRLASLVAGTFPGAFAAFVPIAGISDHPAMKILSDSMAQHRLPIWAFHNQDDPMSDVDDMRNFIALVNGFSPTIIPRLTIFDAYGHDAWSRALDPGYKENGLNIYEWMLQYSR